MTIVIADISMSLDGFVTGPGADIEHGLGEGGEALHVWAHGQDPVDVEILERATTGSGAVVMGRRLFDTVDGPHGWSDEMGYGAGLAATPSFFVVTHEAPEHVRLDLRFTFVTDGLAVAIEQARAVSGDGDVVIMGGGDVIGQAIDERLVDELHLHLAPVVLGQGTPLFRPGTRQVYRQRAVRPSSTVTHLVYERIDD